MKPMKTYIRYGIFILGVVILAGLFFIFGHRQQNPYFSYDAQEREAHP